jgi:hypothetical protein
MGGFIQRFLFPLFSFEFAMSSAVHRGECSRMTHAHACAMCVHLVVDPPRAPLPLRSTQRCTADDGQIRIRPVRSQTRTAHTARARSIRMATIRGGGGGSNVTPTMVATIQLLQPEELQTATPTVSESRGDPLAAHCTAVRLHAGALHRSAASERSCGACSVHSSPPRPLCWPPAIDGRSQQ